MDGLRAARGKLGDGRDRDMDFAHAARLIRCINPASNAPEFSDRPPAMGPNRRAQERERAAARAAAEARAPRPSARQSPTRRRSWQFGTRGKPVDASCGFTRLSAPPSRPVSLGLLTRAQRASKSAVSTCAPSTGTLARRFPASSRRCRADGALPTRRSRGSKC